MKSILDVADNLERALETVPENALQVNVSSDRCTLAYARHEEDGQEK